MRAYVSIDFEGLPGIASISMLSPKYPQFSRGVEVVTKVAKCVAEELLSSGFDRVVIADSHGFMTNIDYGEMPRGVTLIQGFPRPYCMVTGLERGFDALLMIGYHAGAGTMRAILDHTYSGSAFHKIRVNGVQASEYLLNALIAGEEGVPVALVAGDTYLGNQVKEITPWSVFIPLKTGLSRYAAEFDSLEEVLERLKAGIREAAQKTKSKELKPLNFEKPLKVEIEFCDSLIADVVETMPGIERVDAYTIKYETASAKQVFGLIEVIALAAKGIEYLKQYIT